MTKVKEENSDSIKRNTEKIYRHILGDCLGYEQLSVDGIARNLPNIPGGAVFAMISIESTITAAVAARYREDGTDPTDTAGMPAYDKVVFSVDGKGNLSKVKLIQAGAGTHVANIQYY